MSDPDARNKEVSDTSAAQRVQSEPWGQLPDGRPVTLFTLNSASGVRVQLADYGARLVRVQTPDRTGTLGDVTLGHDSLAPYLVHEQAPYFGAVVGRVANRIAGGRFTLDGETFTLAVNNPPNHLHGGPGGFDTVLWSGQIVPAGSGSGVAFRSFSPEGDEGYPGDLDITVLYALSAEGALSFDVQARCTRATPINITNHAFWNLSDGGAGSAMQHTLELAADHYLPISETLIPLGPQAAVQGTPFDFRSPRPLGQRLNADDQQLARAGGYDHHFVLPDRVPSSPGGLRWAATLADPRSGRQMQVWTTEPGLQVYSGNFLDGSIVGRGEARYERHAAVCLETQHAPDSPNQPTFPSVVLRPGETFTTRTEWRFRTH